MLKECEFIQGPNPLLTMSFHMCNCREKFACSWTKPSTLEIVPSVCLCPPSLGKGPCYGARVDLRDEGCLTKRCLGDPSSVDQGQILACSLYSGARRMECQAGNVHRHQTG